MENIIFLAFRRMRRPLLTLIVAHAVAVLGLTLIPGQDGDGNRWYMDFFHAFYFVSFMSTTIGFGEIPFEFSDAQRLWVIFSLYMTVVVWFYAIGNLLSLVQDKGFQQAITERRFSQRIKRQREPFYVICGYGETGGGLVRSLTDRHQNVVAIDIDQERIDSLQLENLQEYVPALCADARRPRHLIEAGLKHALCAGVVAITNVNEANLKIAITSKLLHPKIKVICRADSHDIEANMRSFGTDYIIDPYDTFALHLATALQSPGLYVLNEWLTGISHQPLTEPVYPPHKGHWIVCGFGRFGKAIYRRLKDEGIHAVVIEATPSLTGHPEEGCIEGRGTEAETLEQADIRKAVGLVAGTDNDANNLSIIMTAKELSPGLFVVARQNNQDNESIFEAVGADVVMHPSSIIANKIRVLLGTPLLYRFLSLAMYQEDEWACQLVSRITAIVESELPEVWEIELSPQMAKAVVDHLAIGRLVTPADLMKDPRNRARSLPCIPLLLERRKSITTLPGAETPLKVGDKLLYCGRYSARGRMAWTLQNVHALNYVLTGESRPQGLVWRLLKRWAAT
ncbi:MAG: NAD-binding protein [Gammaproteobacteria bacterium]|nr:NAD-binding protein [Gammaproteobacteria bacterium]